MTLNQKTLKNRFLDKMEIVFLYRHGTTEHTVILGVSILQVFYCFMIGLECVKYLIPHTTARHPFSMIGYLASAKLNFLLNSLLDETVLRSHVKVQLLFQLKIHLFSKQRFHQVRKLSILALVAGTL